MKSTGLVAPPAYINPSQAFYKAYDASGGGGGGAVDSVSAGAGLVVSPTTGDVVVSMPNVGTAGAVSNPASITTDAQGRVSSITSLGYTPVNPTALSAYAPLAGATFTGAVSGIAPTSDANLATKLYVDNAVAGGGSGVYLPLAGGTMTGDINMSGQELTFVSKISNATGDLDLSGNDVNIRQLDAGTEELPNVLNITSAGATAIASGGAITCSAVGAVNLTSGLSTTIYSTNGSVQIGGPINHITVESDGTTVSGVSDLTASGTVDAGALVVSGGVADLSGATSIFVKTPLTDTEATTKAYVDAKASSSPSPFITQVNAINLATPQIFNITDSSCVGGAIFNITTGSTVSIGYEVALPATSQLLPVGTTVILQCSPSNTSYIIVSEQLGAGPFRNNNVYAGGSLQCVVSKVGLSTDPIPYSLTWTNGKTFNSISLSGTEVNEPVVGPIVFDTNANIQCLDIQTGLISALTDIEFISITDPLQTRTVGVRSADGVAPAEIAMALSETAVAPNILTMKYNPAGLDALEVNKDIISNGVNLNDAIAFKDANEFFVSANGSDSTGNGSANAPFQTIQKAIDVASLALSSNIVINVSAGVYNENLTITKGHIVINGNIPSDRAIEGVALNGKITINITDTDNLFNNQVILSGFFLSGQIEDISTKQHTVIVNGMRIESDSALGSRALYIHPTSSTQRTVVQNCIITQEADTVATDGLIDITVGWLDVSFCSLAVRTLSPCINVAGSAHISRLYSTTLESDSTSGSPTSLLAISSTTTSVHNLAQNTFAIGSTTAKADTPAIRVSSASPQTLALAQNFFSIAGTTTATNVIKYSVAPTVVVLVAGNKAVINTASAIQSGATVLPLTNVGETYINSISAGSGISSSTTNGVATISNTGVLELTAGTNITITGTKNNYTINASGGTSGVSSLNSATGALTLAGGSGIGVLTAGETITVSNTGVLSATAGTGISLGGSAFEPVINNTGILAVSVGTGLATTGGTSPTISIADTSVSAGTYTYPSITVNAQGQITTASSLSAVSEVGAGDGISVEAQGTGVVITNSGVRSLTADTGITLGGTANSPSIANDGVLTVNSFKGAISLVGGTNITLEEDTGVITINASGGSTGVVESVVAGTGIVVDSTDPANPTVSNDGVLSVNGVNAQITISGGTNITVSTVGNDVSISAPNATTVSDTVNSSPCTFEGFVSNIAVNDPILNASPTLIFTYTELLELPFWRYTNKVIGYLGYLSMALDKSAPLVWTATVSKNGSAHQDVIGTSYYTDSQYFSVPVNMISQIGVLPDTFLEYSTGDTVEIKFFAQHLTANSDPVVSIAPVALQAIYSPINGGNEALPSSGTLEVNSPVSTLQPLDPANNYRFSNGLGVEATLTTYVSNVPETPVNVAVGATYPPLEDPAITGRDGYTMVEATPVFPSSPITIIEPNNTPAGIDPLITYTFINDAGQNLVLKLYNDENPAGITVADPFLAGDTYVATSAGFNGYTATAGSPSYLTNPRNLFGPVESIAGPLDPTIAYDFYNQYQFDLVLTGYVGTTPTELATLEGITGFYQMTAGAYDGYTATLPPPPPPPSSPITITEPTGETPDPLDPNIQYTFINNAGATYRVIGFINGSPAVELEIPDQGSDQLPFAGFTGYTANPI
jgi:hypothetical protein